MKKNHAAHFTCLDRLFGPLVKTAQVCPDRSGVVGNDMRHGFVPQQCPFRR